MKRYRQRAERDPGAARGRAFGVGHEHVRDGRPEHRDHSDGPVAHIIASTAFETRAADDS